MSIMEYNFVFVKYSGTVSKGHLNMLDSAYTYTVHKSQHHVRKYTYNFSHDTGVKWLSQPVRWLEWEVEWFRDPILSWLHSIHIPTAITQS